MTTANLTTVLKGSVENSRKIGHDLVRVYGAGSRRVLHRVDQGFTKMLAKPVVPLAEPLRERAKLTRKQVVEYANGGVKAASQTAVRAIDTVCDGSDALLGGIHERVQQIENPYATRAVEWIATAGLPAAEFGRTVTEEVAGRTHKLATALARSKAAAATPRRRKAPAKKARR